MGAELSPLHVSFVIENSGACRHFHITVGGFTPLFLPLSNDVPEAAIKRRILSRRRAHTNTRQKQWSELYNPFQML
jgi:hypothetical protein